MQPTSSINVSGGSIDYQGANVQTTQLVMANGQVVNIADATPDQVYQGVYAGESTTSDKWGVTQNFGSAVGTTTFDAGYTQGGNAGSLTINANAVALDGSLYGNTAAGVRQQASPPTPGSLTLNFGTLLASGQAPNPVNIIFQQAPSGQLAVGAFPSTNPAANQPGVTLSSDRLDNIYLSPDLVNVDGFGNLTIVTPLDTTGNASSNITVKADAVISAPAASTITLTAGNFDLAGQIYVPGGTLAINSVSGSPSSPTPYIPALGNITLESGGVLSTAGLSFDELSGSVPAGLLPLTVNGGNISIQGSVTTLDAGSVVDASGGVARTSAGKTSTGTGGTISLTGFFDNNGSNAAGSLILGGTLSAYGVGQGGTLNLTAPAVQVGDTSAFFPTHDVNALVLQGGASGFFKSGRLCELFCRRLGGRLS